jgi:hypothetical protein
LDRYPLDAPEFYIDFLDSIWTGIFHESLVNANFPGFLSAYLECMGLLIKKRR